MSSNSSQPLVSVVVPSYNYGHLVRETLDSLAAQTYGAWECVVVDDGSTDDTRSVVEAYAQTDPRVRYVRQENARQAAARNNGIRHSSGDYFQFLDADDLVEPRKFERQVEYLESHADVDIVYSGVRYFGAGGGELPHSAVLGLGRRAPWMPEVSGRSRGLAKRCATHHGSTRRSGRRAVEAVASSAKASRRRGRTLDAQRRACSTHSTTPRGARARQVSALSMPGRGV